MTAERLRQKYQVDPNTNCWLWQGALSGSSGYGSLRENHKAVYAHRVAWREFVGPIPFGLCVLHRCDNPPCINPDHLFLGTQADNMRDMNVKGKARGGPKSKLSIAAVQEIKTLYPQLRQHEIGDKFGISASYVCNITRGRARVRNATG